MAKQRYYTVIVLDASGSMHGFKEDVVGATNTLIQSRVEAALDKEKLAVIKFSNAASFIQSWIKPAKCAAITTEKYWIGQSTALYDSIAFAIAETNKKIAEDGAVDPKVFISIYTDGYENWSKEFPRERIADLKKLIEESEAKGWQFNYLAGDLDVLQAFEGLVTIHTVTRSFNRNDLDATYRGVSASIGDYYNKSSAKGKSSVQGTLHKEPEDDSEEEEATNTVL